MRKLCYLFLALTMLFAFTAPVDAHGRVGGVGFNRGFGVGIGYGFNTGFYNNFAIAAPVYSTVAYQTYVVPQATVAYPAVTAAVAADPLVQTYVAPVVVAPYVNYSAGFYNSGFYNSGFYNRFNNFGPRVGHFRR